jgi:FG-GAP repeat
MAELTGSGTVAWDWFGASVAVSGNTIVVGAPAAPLLSSGVGRAYAFTRTAAGWHQSAQFESPGILGPDWFGDSVAVSGNTIVVGAPAISALSSGMGRAYVFIRTAAGWQRTADLGGPDSVAGDAFGVSVAVSGNTIVVGAPSHDSKAGAAYVFKTSGQGWQTTELKGSDTVAKDDFGDSVAVSGGTIVVGAFGHASEAGRAYVFTRHGQGWHQTAELSGSGTIPGDGFGDSVAVAGGVIAIGAGLAASDAGRVYLFTKEATGWRQSAKLAGPGPLAKQDFGDSVAVSGDMVVVGTFAQAPSAGRAYLFTSTATGWHQTAELASRSRRAGGNEFGYAVSISGSMIAVGAEGEQSGTGRAYLFEG